MRTDAPRPRRAPVFSLPPCTAHSLFSQKREWGVHWTSPQRAADHPARQREYRPPLRQRSAPPPRPSGRAPAPLSGGKRKPPQATWLRANHKSAVPPEFPLRDTRLPSNGGPPSRPTPSFSRAAPGRLPPPPWRRSHQPRPLLASADRVLLLILAFTWKPVYYPRRELSRGQLIRKISFFSRLMIRFSSLEM